MKINVPNINVPIYLCFVIFERRGIHIVALTLDLLTVNFASNKDTEARRRMLFPLHHDTKSAAC